jgi:hypothetical protein
MLNDAVRPRLRVFAVPLRLGVVLLALFGSPAAATDAIEFDLDQVRWVNRILVVAADTQQQRDLLTMASDAKAHSCQFSNRDLRMLLIVAGNVFFDGKAVGAPSASRLIAQLGLPDEEFAMLLIGKDGGIKQRWRSVVAVQEIFAVIDGMPMRRRESDADLDCR